MINSGAAVARRTAAVPSTRSTPSRTIASTKGSRWRPSTRPWATTSAPRGASRSLRCAAVPGAPPITTTRVRVASVLGDVQLLHMPRHEVDDALTDVGGSIGNPLEVVSDPKHVRRLGDVTRIGDHGRDQLLIGAVVETVDVVVFAT